MSLRGTRTGAALMAAVCASLLFGVLAPPAGAQDDDASQLAFGPRTAIPRPQKCQPGDRPETGMQGRVPAADVLTGRALQGYSCNLTVVGRFPSTSWVSLDGLGDCAYFAREVGGGGVTVMDVSDPARPVPSDSLQTLGMLDPWESLAVNGKRKLLVAANGENPYLDIYDISEDCRHPVLLSSTNMSPAGGHEGWFSPDGMTYFMSASRYDAGSVFPVDISDPRKPKLLAGWTTHVRTASHDGFTTEDNTRTYVCQQAPPPLDSLGFFDTSELAQRKPNPKPKLLHEEFLGENQWCQGMARVTYKGHPHLIQYGERAGAPECSRSADNWASFSYPRIYDLADERAPRLVSTAMLESSLPANCQAVQGDALAINGFGYSVHHCSPDRLYDPTILVCSWFSAGLRVLDIRDPHQPRELAYFNPGTTVPVGILTKPVVRADRGEIWITGDTQGFFVLRFADGVWPFAGAAPCPEYDDWLFATYNETSKCPTANFNGLGKPAPGTPGPAPVANAGKLTPRLSLRVVRRGRRYRVGGRLRVQGAACSGRIVLKARRGGRTVLVRRLRLTRTCRFSTTVKRRGRLTFVARFPGTAQLKPATARSPR